MKIRYDPFSKDNWVHWFLMALTSEKLTSGELDFDKDEEGCYTDVQVFVKGVDVSDKFAEAIERLKKHLERDVKETAKELVTERLNNILDNMYEIQREYERKLCELLGITINEDE